MVILTELPSVLYRYRPSSSDYFEDEVRELKNNGLFLTPAPFLNDPFDCSPAIVPSSIQEVAKEIRKYGLDNFRRFRMRRARESGLYGKREIAGLRAQYTNSLIAAKFEAPLANSVLEAYKERDLLVSCLSEVEDSVLMWSHYAESHKGFVVKYSVSFPKDIGANSALPLPVKYTQDRPKFTTIELMRWRLTEAENASRNGDSIQEGLYLTKSALWKNEREWRLVEPERKGTGYYHYENLVPTEIIVGVKMPDEKLEFMRDSLSHLSFKKAVLDGTSYELMFENIS